MDQQSAVFINVFDVEPERQHELVTVLQEGVDRVIRHRPGFIGLSLFASRDGRRVVNVALWESAEAAGMTQGDPEAAEYAARAAVIGTATPGLFSLAAEIR